MKLKRLWIGLTLCLVVFAQLAVLNVFLPKSAASWPSAGNVKEHPISMVNKYQRHWSLYWCTLLMQGGATGNLQESRNTNDLREGKIFSKDRSRWNNHLTNNNNDAVPCDQDPATLFSWLGLTSADEIFSFLTTELVTTGPNGTTLTIPPLYVLDGSRYVINPDMDSLKITALFNAKFREAQNSTGARINFGASTMPDYAQYFVLRETFLQKCVASGDYVLNPNGNTTVRLINDSTGAITPTTYLRETGEDNWHRAGYGVTVPSNDSGWGRFDPPKEPKCERIVTLIEQYADSARAAITAYLLDCEGSTGGCDRPDTEQDNNQGATCEDAGGMAWLFCALLGVVSDTLNLVDKQMSALLDLNTDFFEDSALRDAWTILRNLSYLILVPMMLVMVIATALGFEFISAYTVKSALPRMVIAIVFIALSYDITVFLVDFVQTVGHGIHNLLLSPFDGLETMNLESILTVPEGPLIETGLSGLVAWGAVAAAGTLGLGAVSTILGFAGVAALIFLAVFLLILFRQAIIVLLVLLAPLAILAWIFPGRDKLWGIWNKTFWLMLWFFPLIMMATAAGKIMAWIVSQGGLFN